MFGFRSLVARLAPFKRGGTKRAKFFGYEKCELTANFSATMVTITKRRRDGKCEGRNERGEFLARESVNS